MRLQNRSTLTYVLYGSLVLVIVYFSLLVSDMYQAVAGQNLLTIPRIVSEKFSLLKNPITIYTTTTDLKQLLLGQLFVSVSTIAILYYEIDKRSQFHGEEKGSADWATEKDREEYRLNNFEGNLILSNTEFLPKNTDIIHRNLNVAILGGSGTQKTRTYSKPNLMQCNTSFVITDPKGELYKECGGMLRENGYEVKALNLKKPAFSAGFNPFRYVEDEKDIDVLADTIKKNTLQGKKKQGDDFFDKAANALLKALLHYVNSLDDHEQNLPKVLDLVLKGKVEEEGEQTELDKIFEELKYKKPNHAALRYYEIFKLGPKDTRNSVLITLGTQLAFLGSSEIENIVTKDTLDLRNHKEKRAIFLIIPDSNSAYNVLASIFFTQMFQVLYDEADKQPEGELDIHHQFILDEFANIGKIPDFDKKISTMRSREVSAKIIVQNEAQIKDLYGKETAKTILGNCDSVLYMGGSDQTAAKEISERLGDTTTKVVETSEQKSAGGGNSYTKNKRKVKRKLMTPDEVLRLDDDKLILSIRGFKPFLSKKYEPSQHENYKYLEDKSYHLDYTKEYEKRGNVNDLEQLENEVDKALDKAEELENKEPEPDAKQQKTAGQVQ